jgi:Lon protease-like protein
MSELIPIFPLELVVYPGEELNLHIFEPRYKQLINDCAKTKTPFGIPTVLNQQVGELGTLVQLTEIANVQADGQMDVRTLGLKVFRVKELLKLYPGKLYSGARVDYQADDSADEAPLPPQLLADLKKLHGLLKVEKAFPKSDDKLTSFDLAHHAGLTLKQEFELLGLMDERARQEYLRYHLHQILQVVVQLESLKEKIKLNGHFKHLPGFEV